MKKTLAIILTVFMIVPLLTMSITAAPAEADASVAGLTFNGDTTYGASEEYYPEKLLEDIPHTFSAWVRLSDAQMKQASAIASTYPAASRYTGYVHFELAAGGKPRLVWGDTNDSSANDDTRATHDFTFNTSVKANTWTYITIVVDDGAAEVRCYIDGKLAETLTDGYSPMSPTVIDYRMMLGGDFRQSKAVSNGSYFKGELKDVHLYADARTSAEIARDYANGADLNDDLLICAYDIDASDKGKNIEDISGNGYHQTYNKVWITEEELRAIKGDTSDRAYSFAVIPDTQYATEFNLGSLNSVYEWIVANKEAKNIQFVFGVGDITNTDTDIAQSSYNGPYEWKAAYEAISMLNGVVPYSLVRGNHDVYSTEAGGGVTSSKGQKFLEYFGGDDDFYAQQFKNPVGYEAGYYEGTLANIKGVEETDSVANTWRTLELYGDKWLLLNLDWGVHDDILKWAGNIIEAHPEHRVIITTHNYLTHNGYHTSNCQAGDVTSGNLQKGFNNGNGIWDKLVSRYSNIEMVLCGHISAKTVVVAQNKGIYGNTVTQLLIDGQNLDRYWGGLGLVAMLYVSEDGNTIDIEYYSTAKKMYLSSMSHRTVDLDAEGTEPVTAWDGKSMYSPAGSGTKADPYRVTCAENLAWMAKKCNYVSGSAVNPFAGMYFVQTNDIDLNGHQISQIGCYYDSTSKLAVFGGTYDGQGYAIRNGSLSKHSSAAQNQKWGVGIFGVTYGATINNVVADNITVSGLTRTGAIVGFALDTYINRCVSTSTCTVIGTGTPTSLSSTSSVFGTEQFNVFSQNRLGGIVGHFYGTSYKFQINDCKSSATILAKGNNALSGGIVGSIQNQMNMYRNVFDGKIINDFVDPGYNRTVAGENVNGGIVGYVGSGSYTMSGTNRYISDNVNKGSFEIIGVATTDVIYGGIVGAVKDITPANYRIEDSYNLSNDIELNGDKYTQTKAIYIGGIVGRITNDKATTARTLKLANCASVPLNIANGGVNVDKSAFTIDNLYVHNTTSGTKPVSHELPNGVTEGTVDVATKELKDILTVTDTMEKTYEATRKAVRNKDSIFTIGYQKATEENDLRVRLVFGLNTLDLANYGYEMTLSFVDANGDTVTKTADIESVVVYSNIAGGEKNYNAKTDFGYEYFATLVIAPMVGGSVISGTAKCTVSAYTVTSDGAKICYGVDLITLTFTDGVLTEPVANIK